jgi:hypothetical protein
VIRGSARLSGETLAEVPWAAASPSISSTADQPGSPVEGGADLELRRDLCERDEKARKGFMVVER